MGDTTAATNAVHAILNAHTRALSPTGSGARCTCGHQAPHPDAWRRHVAELAAAAALAHPPTP